MGIVGTVGSVLGIGWPWQPSLTGLPQQVVDQQAVHDNLFLLYTTQVGEDVTNPEFGLDLISFLFETSGDLQNSLVRAEVERATARWEPRVRVVNTTVEGKEDAEGGSEVDVLTEYEFLGIEGSVSTNYPTPTP